jgi:hypothetical protein
MSMKLDNRARRAQTMSGYTVLNALVVLRRTEEEEEERKTSKREPELNTSWPWALPESMIANGLNTLHPRP